MFLATAGATLGTALDAIHVHTGATRYTTPALFGLAWWVPLLFGAAAVAIGLGRPLTERILGTVSPAPRGGPVLFGMLLFAAGYVVSSVGPGGSTGRAAALGVIAAVGWIACDRHVAGLVHALLTAAGGVLVEATLVRAGAFEHTHVDFLGLAGWLPVLYLCAAVGVGALGKRLVDGPAPAHLVRTSYTPSQSSAGGEADRAVQRPT
ncbi:MAG TPA: hypothetical protein VGR62_11230 [Candidatus Binatia bacterium]|nr:hypothetical protein [Candidatus Binatia bacterium]